MILSRTVANCRQHKYLYQVFLYNCLLSLAYTAQNNSFDFGFDRCYLAYPPVFTDIAIKEITFALILKNIIKKHITLKRRTYYVPNLLMSKIFLLGSFALDYFRHMKRSTFEPDLSKKKQTQKRHSRPRYDDCKYWENQELA